MKYAFDRVKILKIDNKGICIVGKRQREAERQRLMQELNVLYRKLEGMNSYKRYREAELERMKESLKQLQGSNNAGSTEVMLSKMLINKQIDGNVRMDTAINALKTQIAEYEQKCVMLGIETDLLR